MSSIGPELPPHLASKRKRQVEEEYKRDEATSVNKASAHRDASDLSSSGPPAKTPRTWGPTVPESSASDLSPTIRRSYGGANEDSEEEDEDDDYGPRLPQSMAENETKGGDSWQIQDNRSPKLEKEGAPTPRRDEWMTVPPKQDDLAARMDPTKVRARKFNTGRAANSQNKSGQDSNALWTETPQQKRKRLEDEQLGIAPPADRGEETQESAKKRLQDEEKAKRIKDHNEKHRARPLISQHLTSAERKQEDDDPTKRGFEYEKDMGSSVKMGHSQKRELLQRSAEFGSRFSGGSYL